MRYQAVKEVGVKQSEPVTISMSNLILIWFQSSICICEMLSIAFTRNTKQAKAGPTSPSSTFLPNQDKKMRVNASPTEVPVWVTCRSHMPSLLSTWIVFLLSMALKEVFHNPTLRRLVAISWILVDENFTATVSLESKGSPRRNDDVAFGTDHLISRAKTKNRLDWKKDRISHGLGTAKRRP